MWHLDDPSPDLIQWYKGRMLTGLADRVWNKSGFTVAEKTVLMPNGANDTSVLEHLLTDKPQDLFARNNTLMPVFIPQYDDAELDNYVKALHNFPAYRTPAQNALLAKYQQKLKQIHETFAYPTELSGNKSRSYRLTREIGENTCVYCNRQYAFNIEKDGGKNGGTRFARPALDHWFPESIYPLLSLSIYNLIPSCTVCNSSAKGDTIFRLSTHVNPYCTTSNDPSWKFDYKPNVNGGWDIAFDSLTDPKEKATAEAFVLGEAYQAHAELELKDLLTIALENGGSYVPTLIKHILTNVNGVTKESAYRLLLGTEFDADKYDERPFSKFKKDILEKAGVII